ncbi:tRNA (adenosine(37)-N6)-threonylcarbamoyltransferase complex dimerization subunit type 1 TsaB [candidate division KSB1 bacterium]|nr:MAG: tRNA (adenosine(37)-N6)-threonylcarbamoyltransferase complex dimerization subunit type 1 TsaB [candidate division KSB1 bacterium]
MMLCLESSAEPTVIGLVREETVLIERVFAERDRMADEIESVLREASVAVLELKSIAVGIGPGSFTGLRVSLAIAKGMALGLSFPIWPVASLKIIAANFAAGGRSIAVISPARRGQAHYAVFDCLLLEPVDGPCVLDYADLPSRLPEDAILTGPGVAKLDANLHAQLNARIPDDLLFLRPQIIHLARLAREEWQDREPPDIGSLVPFYGLDFPA